MIRRRSDRTTRSISASTDMFALDTNMIAFALNNRRRGVRDRIGREIQVGMPLIISSIVLMELEYGFARSSKPVETERMTRAYLAQGFTISDFTPEDARIAGHVRADLARRGEPIGPYDVLIAAHALRLDATLATDNIREFSRVPGLRIENWAI